MILIINPIPYSKFKILLKVLGSVPILPPSISELFRRILPFQISVSGRGRYAGTVVLLHQEQLCQKVHELIEFVISQRTGKSHGF